MKSKCLSLLLCIFILSCKANSADSVQRGVLYEAKKIDANPALTYAIYIPQKEKYSKRVAMFYFDPSGDGTLPLKLYKSLADSLDVVLIGNNHSKNGMDFNSIAENFAAIYSDVLKKYQIDKKDMCLWGFSGGAKAAMYCADNFGFQYAIYGGAVYPQLQNNIELLGINGTKDMNYTDLLAYDISQQKSNNHLQLVWNGKHAWPDSLTASDAFKWFLFKKMQKNEILWDSKLILKTNKQYTQEVKKYYVAKQYYKTYITGKKTIMLLDKLSNVDPVKVIVGNVVKSPQFLTEMKQLENLYKKETDLKNKYIPGLSVQDSVYWRTETDKLYKLAKIDKNGIYDRVLGFLSLASYSVASDAFRKNELGNMLNILALYRYADPKNPEHAFMSAKYYALQNAPDKVKQYMQDALYLGINISRFEQDEVLSKYTSAK